MAAQLETGRLRIAQSEMGRELIGELAAFEVMCAARDHHGDLVIATALALWSESVVRPAAPR